MPTGFCGEQCFLRLGSHTGTDITQELSFFEDLVGEPKHTFGVFVIFEKESASQGRIDILRLNMVQ